jgi:predicted ester cyclase
MEEIETRYCQYVEDVLNRHHLDRLADYLAADVVSHPGVGWGRTGARQLVVTLVTAFPDFHLTINALAAMEDQLVSRLTATGTHTGTYLGLPATGRRFRVGAFGAWSFRDRRCAEQWLQLDLHDLFRQLGTDLTTRLRVEATVRCQPEGFES